MLASLSLAAVAGLPVLLLLVRFRVFTFHDDFTGVNALGFVIGSALALCFAGAVLGAFAWCADPPSWPARGAFALNLVLLVFPLWLKAKMSGLIQLSDRGARRPHLRLLHGAPHHLATAALG